MGVPNSMLQRSNDSFERDSDGAVYYFTVDDKGNVNGKTTNSDDDNIQRAGKNNKPVKVGVATGIKMISTFLDREGNRFISSKVKVAQKVALEVINSWSLW